MRQKLIGGWISGDPSLISDGRWDALALAFPRAGTTEATSRVYQSHWQGKDWGQRVCDLYQDAQSKRAKTFLQPCQIGPCRASLCALSAMMLGLNLLLLYISERFHCTVCAMSTIQFWYSRRVAGLTTKLIH